MNDYERFVNAFAASADQAGKVRQEVVEAASDAWHTKYKHDEDALNAFLRDASKKTDGPKIDFGFTVRSTPQPTQHRSLPPRSRPLQPPSTGPLLLEGSTLATSADKVKVAFDQSAIATFLDTLGVNPDLFFVDDVVGLYLFMQGLQAAGHD